VSVADTAVPILRFSSSAELSGDLVGETVEIQAVDKSTNDAMAIALVANPRKRQNILKKTFLNYASWPRPARQTISYPSGIQCFKRASRGAALTADEGLLALNRPSCWGLGTLGLLQMGILRERLGR